MTVSRNHDAPAFVRRRAPALPVVLAFVVGIVVDANVAAVGWWSWAFSATALLLAGLTSWLRCSNRYLSGCQKVQIVSLDSR